MRDSQEGPGVENRRSQVRLACAYQVECSQEQEKWPATVVDIGLAGLGIEWQKELRPGDQLRLSYRPGGRPIGRQRLRCEVVWSTPGAAGLKFFDSEDNLRVSWIQTVLDELGFDEHKIFRRRYRRARGALPVVVDLTELNEDRNVEGTVSNIGVGGALVEISAEVPEGIGVNLIVGPYQQLPKLELFGRVVSCRCEEEAYFLSVRFLSRGHDEVALLGKYVIGLLKDSTPGLQ